MAVKTGWSCRLLSFASGRAVSISTGIGQEEYPVTINVWPIDHAFVRSGPDLPRCLSVLEVNEDQRRIFVRALCHRPSRYETRDVHNTRRQSPPPFHVTVFRPDP